MGLILTLVVLVVLVSALPAWPYSRTWGYAPGSVLAAVLLIVLLLMILGPLPFWFTPVGPAPGTVVHP
jgi:hypothetical protein